MRHRFKFFFRKFVMLVILAMKSHDTECSPYFRSLSLARKSQKWIVLVFFYILYYWSFRIIQTRSLFGVRISSNKRLLVFKFFTFERSIDDYWFCFYLPSSAQSQHRSSVISNNPNQVSTWSIWWLTLTSNWWIALNHCEFEPLLTSTLPSRPKWRWLWVAQRLWHVASSPGSKGKINICTSI